MPVMRDEKEGGFLRKIHVVLESVRVAQIVVAADDASATILDYFGDSLEIAIQPVDLEPMNSEPRPAVDPGTPFAKTSYLSRGFAGMKMLREPPEKFH